MSGHELQHAITSAHRCRCKYWQESAIWLKFTQIDSLQSLMILVSDRILWSVHDTTSFYSSTQFYPLLATWYVPYHVDRFSRSKSFSLLALYTSKYCLSLEALTKISFSLQMEIYSSLILPLWYWWSNLSLTTIVNVLQ